MTIPTATNTPPKAPRPNKRRNSYQLDYSEALLQLDRERRLRRERHLQERITRRVAQNNGNVAYCDLPSPSTCKRSLEFTAVDDDSPPMLVFETPKKVHSSTSTVASPSNRKQRRRVVMRPRKLHDSLFLPSLCSDDDDDEYTTRKLSRPSIAPRPNYLVGRYQMLLLGDRENLSGCWFENLPQ